MTVILSFYLPLHFLLYMSNPPAQRHRFTEEEDMKLKDLVETYGTNDWELIGSKMNMSRRQCRERYKKYLKPNISQRNWDYAEDTNLLSKVQELGHKWKLIAKILDRTDIQVKNRYSSLMRKSLRYNQMQLQPPMPQIYFPQYESPQYECPQNNEIEPYDEPVYADPYDSYE